MNIFKQKWNKLGITGKFSLAFALMLVFMLLISVTSYCSFLYIGNARQIIWKSSTIGQLVLEMDRGLEKARRLHGSFFIQYEQIGLQAAHETYAQPSVREIAKVISLSRELKKLISSSNSDNRVKINPTDINLYLSSAERFAETSIEAVELISLRAAPKRGVEAKLQTVFLTLERTLQPLPEIWPTFMQGYSLYKDYLANRQRFIMQSTLNIFDKLPSLVTTTTSIGDESKTSITTLLATSRKLTEELLAIDLAIKSKLRDFSLQEQTVSPLSKKLHQITQKEIKQARDQVGHIYRLTIAIMLFITFLAACAVLFIAWVMHNSVTKNVIKLTNAAEAFNEDNLNARVHSCSQDELGQLGIIFNKMAERLKDLVENLEKKVTKRTAELSASEQRFRLLVNNLPKIAVQGYDIERKVIYWNRASETLYGFSTSEAMGKRVEEIIIPAPMRETLITEIQNWFDNDIAIPASEMILQDKDGGEVPVYTSHVMLTDIHGERVIYTVDIGLTELKLAQEEGRKNQLFYRQLFSHSSSGVAVFETVADGRDFIFKDINKAGEAISKVKRDDLLGKSVIESFPSIEKIGLLDVYRQVWQTGVAQHHPASFYQDDRQQAWREYRVYKLPSGEIVVLYDDITNQKQAEIEKNSLEQRLLRAQKMEAIGLLAGGVAHDLNNILSGVVGYPELLLAELPKDSALRPPLEATKEAGERATAVVADLLTVARGIANTKEPGDLSTLTREYLNSPEFIKLQSQKSQIHFREHLASTLPLISCSPVHVKKCIMNLVQNGSEAIEKEGSVTLTTTTRIPDAKWLQKHGLPPKEYVILSVSDTGMGIQDKDLEHIFEPFYTKKVMGNLSGTGLGLSIVWNTMQDHQGAVIVSRTESATTFELYFPATREITAANKPIGHHTEEQGNGEKILVVDDEPQLRDLAKSMLTLLGYNVTCQDSGENALAYLQSQQVDLVLLDMLMEPGINGRETYERMLEIHPGQKAIIASGLSESDDVKAAQTMGAGGFIQKPYSIKQLGKSVKKVLRN